jgi:hypothetical protein
MNALPCWQKLTVHVEKNLFMLGQRITEHVLGGWLVRLTSQRSFCDGNFSRRRTVESSGE